MATHARHSTAHAPLPAPRQSRVRRRSNTPFYPSRRSALPPAGAFESSIPGVAPWQAADAPRSQLVVSFPCYSTDEAEGNDLGKHDAQSSASSSSSAPRRRRSSSNSLPPIRRNPAFHAKGTPPASLVAMMNPSVSDSNDYDHDDESSSGSALRSRPLRQSAPPSTGISTRSGQMAQTRTGSRAAATAPFARLDSDDDTTVDTASTPTSSELPPSEASANAVEYAPVVTSSSFAERLQAFSKE